MNRIPEISVIIPVFNVSAYIEHCISSLLTQAFQDYELVLVDDCSTDNSIQLALDLLQKHPSISRQVILHPQNKGLSAARNTGIKASNGRYIVFVDSDDWVPPNMLEIFYREIIKFPGSIVCGNTTQSIDGVYSPYWASDQRLILDRAEGIKRMLTYKNVIDTAWAKIYEKKLFIDNGIEFPEGLYFEDTPTNIRLFNLAKTIIVTPETVYFYRRNRPGSILQERSAKSVKDRMWAFGYIYSYLISETTVDRDFALNYYIIRMASEYRNIFGNNNLTLKQQYELSRSITSTYYRLKRENRTKNFRKQIGIKFSFLLKRNVYKYKLFFVLLHNNYYSFIEYLIDL